MSLEKEPTGTFNKAQRLIECAQYKEHSQFYKEGSQFGSARHLWLPIESRYMGQPAREKGLIDRRLID
jgi:hypothetical protein